MKRVAIVKSRFNEEITSRLLASCLKTFRDEGWTEAQLKVVEVPGGWELPWAAHELAKTGRYSAIVALGCVLKGETPQNEHISRSLVQHLHKVSLDTRVPIALGVITPNTLKQAAARTKGSMDRGREAALAALELIALQEELLRGA